MGKRRISTMKNQRFMAIGVLGFALGLGTGVIWMKGSRAREEAATAVAGTHPTRSSVRTTAAESDMASRTKRGLSEAKSDAKKQQADRSALLAERTRPLVEGAMQLNNEVLAKESLEKIREAMGSDDPLTTLVGMRAFTGLYELDFDKASFRGKILPHLESKDDDLRAAAWSALMMSGLQLEDAAHMRQVARSTGMGSGTSYLLFSMEKGDLTGESGDIVRGLIDWKDPAVTREVLRGTWGSQYAPALEEEIIAISREPAFLNDAVYFALSTERKKSKATVDRLIEVLSHPDSHNVGGRAAWGLGYGVAPEQAPAVADAAVKIVSSRTTGYLTQGAWDLLDRYAGPEQLEEMQELAAKPNLDEERRKKVNEIIVRLGRAPD